MRFLKLFFTKVLFLGLAATVLVLGVMELRLRLGAWQLRTDMAAINRMAAVSSQTDRDKCEQPAGIPVAIGGKPIYPVAGYQLRFTDKWHYRVELLCSGYEEKPLLLYQRSLGYGVSKNMGTGIRIAFYGENGPVYETNAWVRVGYQWRQLDVGYFKGTLGWHETKFATGAIAEADVPHTLCTGAGGRCCSSLTEVGVGTALPGITDCSASCYDRCYERPVVVFFNSDPLMDQTDRTVTLTGRSQTVTMGWEINDSDSTGIDGSIAFGDGTVVNHIASKDVVNHTYTCDRLPCRFTAELSVIDSEGNTLANSRQRKLEVVMLP